MVVSPWMIVPLLFLSSFQGELGGGAFAVSRGHGRKSVGIYLILSMPCVQFVANQPNFPSNL